MIKTNDLVDFDCHFHQRIIGLENLVIMALDPLDFKSRWLLGAENRVTMEIFRVYFDSTLD